MERDPASAFTASVRRRVRFLVSSLATSTCAPKRRTCDLSACVYVCLRLRNSGWDQGVWGGKGPLHIHVLVHQHGTPNLKDRLLSLLSLPSLLSSPLLSPPSPLLSHTVYTHSQGGRERPAGKKVGSECVVAVKLPASAGRAGSQPRVSVGSGMHFSSLRSFFPSSSCSLRS